MGIFPPPNTKEIEPLGRSAQLPPIHEENSHPTIQDKISDILSKYFNKRRNLSATAIRLRY